jgi:peptidoglycan/xylan/chitin deacetylase (PgdA/CDA1 family)
MYKKILLKVLFKSFSNKFFSKLAKGAKILCYHGVEKEIIDNRVQIAHMHIENFEQQMKYLKKNYEIISIDYLAECIKYKYQLHPHQVCISFDDGYKNNLLNVSSIMKTYNFPYSVFVPTWHIDNGERLPTYYIRTAVLYTHKKTIKLSSINRVFFIETDQDRLHSLEKIIQIVKRVSQNLVKSIVKECYDLLDTNQWLEINNKFHSDELMNWNEVKKIMHLGASIGSHCHNHGILHAKQTPTQIDYELRTSKNLIEKHIGNCRYIAYPNGAEKDISGYALRSVQQHKYVLGMTLISGEIVGNVNPFFLPRIWAPQDFDIFKYAVHIQNHVHRLLGWN